MNRILRLRDGSALNIVGIVAIGLLLATVAIAVIFIMPVYAMYKHPPTLSTASRATAQAVDKFHDSMTRSVEMVDGRSWFYEPKAPEALVEKPKVAARYAGPQLLAFINGTAWFADGQKISVAQPKSKTLELVKTNAPWSITVKWEGGTFDVDLFKKVDLISLKDGGGFTSSYPAATASFGARPPDGAATTNLNGRPPSDRGDLPPEGRSGPGVAPPASPATGDAPASIPGVSPAPQPAPSPPSAPPAPSPAEPAQPAPANPSPPSEGQIIISKPSLSPAPQPEPNKSPVP